MDAESTYIQAWLSEARGNPYILEGTEPEKGERVGYFRFVSRGRCKPRGRYSQHAVHPASNRFAEQINT